MNTSTRNKQSKNGVSIVYTAEPLWHNLLYGLGTGLVFSAPFLISHESEQFVFLFYLAIVAMSYTFFCVWGIIHAIRRYNANAHYRGTRVSQVKRYRY